MDRALSAAFVVCATFFAAPPPLAAAPPGTPVDLRALPGSNKQIRLTWIDTAHDEQGFRVELNDNGTFRLVKTVPANRQATNVGGLTENQYYQIRIRSFRGSENSPFSSVAGVYTDDHVAPSTCTPNTTTGCLGPSNRFRVQAFYKQSGFVDPAVVQEVTPDAGLFYFFNTDNVEVLVRVLNGCGPNKRYWIFFAGTTNVEYTLTVTDTQAGRVRRYFNPAGNRPAPAVQDTSAFATCP